MGRRWKTSPLTATALEATYNVKRLQQWKKSVLNKFVLCFIVFLFILVGCTVFIGLFMAIPITMIVIGKYTWWWWLQGWGMLFCLKLRNGWYICRGVILWFWLKEFKKIQSAYNYYSNIMHWDVDLQLLCHGTHKFVFFLSSNFFIFD